MPLILGANSVSGYNIANSLRFNSGSADYLNRNPSTSPTTWTLSVWVKRANLGTSQAIVGSRNVSVTSWGLSFTTGNALTYIRNGVSVITTTDLYRDTSAWYHVVLSSTLNGTVQLYVNGVSVGSTAAGTNSFLFVSTAGYVNAIGRRGDATDAYYNGYMSEFYFIEGQQLTPSSFGSTDTDTGIWIPKKYTGTFGTNGAYLEFKNSASLGTDTSGNGNTFTVNNLTSIDQTTDTPTNNFATWNPLFFLGNQTFTEGNLRLATGTTGGSIGSIAVNTGKWYWETKLISSGTPDWRIAGLVNVTVTSLTSTGSVYYVLNGNKGINNVFTSYGATLANNDIIGTAIDVDARSVTFYKNGVSQGAIDISSVYNVGDYITASGVVSGGASTTVEINFGNAPFTIVSGNADANGYGNFEYAVPSGYYALCTKNLANFG